MVRLRKIEKLNNLTNKHQSQRKDRIMSENASMKNVELLTKGRGDWHQNNAQATYRNMRVSAQKVRLVLDQIRSMKVVEAMHVLSLSPKRCAKYVLCLLRSAIANLLAKIADQSNLDKIVINSTFADEGKYIKRRKPGSRGTPLTIIRRTSHVTIQLTIQLT